MTDELESVSQSVVVYEHQRRFPIKGFSCFLFPGDPPAWADEAGRPLASGSLSDIRPGCGWAWCSAWKPCIPAGSRIDTSGWSYACSFSTKQGTQWSTHANKARVRRRCWKRLRHRQSCEGTADHKISGDNCTRRDLKAKVHVDTVCLRGCTSSPSPPTKPPRQTQHVQQPPSASDTDAAAGSNKSIGDAYGCRSFVSADTVESDFKEAVLTLQARAAECAKLKMWSQAVTLLSQAISADSSRAELYAARSQALCVCGEYAKALTDANYCIVIEVASAVGYICKGQALMQMRQFDRAAQSFRQAAQFDPVNEKIQPLLALCERSVQLKARPAKSPSSLPSTTETGSV